MRSRKAQDRLVRLGWAAVDGSIWVVAVVLAFWLRYLYSFGGLANRVTWIAALVAAILHIVIGFAAGPYRLGHVQGSFDEVVDVVGTTVATSILVLAWAIAARPGVVVPRTVPVIAAFIAITFMMCARFLVRSANRHKQLREQRSQRVIVFGAGRGGRLLVRNLLNDNTSPYLPVAVLDDDPRMRHVVLDGVKVHGTRRDIKKVADAFDADLMVIAIPSASGEALGELSDLANVAGLKTKVVPPIHTLVGQNPSAADLRDLKLEDLLGRRPITLDERAISAQLTGRRVLVTGAGGSIGSELCRQIHKFSPAKLSLLDRDESALHGVQLDLVGHGLLDDDSMVLADIRDAEAVRKVFLDARPEVVFHAAALKHLPMLERYPLEAWKTNVLGTLNVLTAAREAGVETFVNISTDKAADPTSVLGHSKRCAERLTADMAMKASGRYMSVRFGNVLGSRGSVIPASKRQIMRGGPITVTHPDVERYFTLIPEACQLVMQAAVMGRHGEVMVLDMGRPVKIVDVAKTMIQMSGREDVEIVYTGLRPGEKMSEDLFDRTDESEPTGHPLVSCVEVPPLRSGDLKNVSDHSDAALTMRAYATQWQREALTLVGAPTPLREARSL